MRVTNRSGSRERLITAARDELVACGGHLEMKAVAKRAGVSVGLAYHHFGSKAGLLAATVDAFYDALDAVALGVEFVDGSWAAQERERIRRYVSFHFEEPFAELMLGRLVTEPEVITVWQARLEQLIEQGTRNIARAQRRGEIPATTRPDVTVAMLLGGIHQAISTALASSGRPSPEELADALWTLVVSAVGAKPDAGTVVPSDERSDDRGKGVRQAHG